MAPMLAEEGTISPYDELIAYECLYAEEGTSRARISSIIADGGGLPSAAFRSRHGLFPDEERISEVKEFVEARIGSFSVLVDGTPQFPTGLRAEKNPLPVFYYRGDINLVSSPCVSVVGTRHPSERGALAARRVARALAERGYTVVAGLATGIDTCAMTEAIDTGGSVIGVIGTPIDRCYPRKNEGLQQLVATKHLLISQVPLYRYEHQPIKSQRFYFPERNITMAALSTATIIVEAGETSGTRTQAKACIDQHKQLIFLPSAVESASWAEGFLQKGAVVASTVTETIEAIGS